MFGSLSVSWCPCWAVVWSQQLSSSTEQVPGLSDVLAFFAVVMNMAFKWLSWSDYRNSLLMQIFMLCAWLNLLDGSPQIWAAHGKHQKFRHLSTVHLQLFELHFTPWWSSGCEQWNAACTVLMEQPGVCLGSKLTVCLLTGVTSRLQLMCKQFLREQLVQRSLRNASGDIFGWKLWEGLLNRTFIDGPTQTSNLCKWYMHVIYHWKF